ncbi:cytochrome c oxidase, cbb3-type, subunit I, partial [mine drainage metagenome]
MLKKSVPEGTASRTMFFSSILWLAIGTTLGFVTSLKLAYPDILSGTPYLNFGHIRPAHVMTVAFMWISMAFGAAVLYMTPLLCGNKLWSEKLGVFNAWMWNLGGF